MIKVTKKIKFVSGLMAVHFLLFSCLELAPAYSAQLQSTVSLQLDLPQKFGNIKDVYRGTSDKIVYYIQDSHTSLEAQQSIARILDFLVQSAHVPLVFEEGYEGKVPSDEYFNLTDPDLKRRTAFFFLDHLRIGGAEYAHILRRKPFRLIGIDSLNLYKKNVRQYARVQPLQKMIAKDLESIEKKLQSLVPKLFPREFYQWFKVRGKYLRGEAELPRYLDETLTYYRRLCAEHSVIPESFPQVERIHSLFSGIPAESAGFPPEDTEQLLVEMNLLERSVTSQALLPGDARRLYSYLDTLQVLKRLVYLQMSSHDFERYCRQIQKLKTKEISGFLLRHGLKNFVVSSYWEEWIHAMSQFYDLALEREKSIDGVLQHKWKRAALVYGGFHEQSILEKLREQGVSYVVISPAVKKNDPVHEERYQALMGGGHYAFESGLFAQAARPPSLYVMAAPRAVKRLIATRAGLLLQARSEVRKPLTQSKAAPEKTLPLTKRAFNSGMRLIYIVFFRVAAAGLIMAAALFILSPTTRPWISMAKQMTARQMERLGVQGSKENRSAGHAENSETLFRHHPGRTSVFAMQIAKMPVEQASKILANLNRLDVRLIAAEHAKPDHRQDESQVAALAQAVSMLSYDRAQLYELAYKTALLHYDSSAAAKDQWVKTYRKLSDNPKTRETSALRSIASVLDMLPAPFMISLLEQAARPEMTAEVITEMPYIDTPHKDRLVNIQERFVPQKNSKTVSSAAERVFLNPVNFEQTLSRLAQAENWRTEDRMFFSASALRELLSGAVFESSQQKEIISLYENHLKSFSTEGIFSPAEETLWAEMHLRFAVFLKSAAAENIPEETRKKYDELAENAGSRGLKYAAQLQKNLPSRLHEENAEDLDRTGAAYPDWVFLFDAAFQWDKNPQWNQSLRHVARNLLANQALSKNKAFSEYVMTEFRQPVLVYEGKEFDLFEGLQGSGDLMFSAVYGGIPAFDVGTNAEQQRQITESEIQVIQSVQVRAKNGQVIDELVFHYDAGGVLTDIESQTHALKFKTQSKPMLKRMTVYVIDLKTGIPNGSVYESINNKFGQMQYWVMREMIDIRGGVQKKSVNVIMKDARGRARLDWAAMSGVLPDSGLFRTSNRTDAPKSIAYQGRVLAALARIRQRAVELQDSLLASDARTAADLALQPFFDHTGAVRINERGQLWALDFFDRRQTVLPIFSQPEDRLWLLYGASFWMSDFEQAHELIHKSASVPPQKHDLSEALMAPFLLRDASAPAAGSWHSSGSSQTLIDLPQNVERYFRYGQTTAEFKWAKAVLEPVRLDIHQPDFVFLKWQPLAQAHWYLVRQYVEMPGGHWKLVEKNDQWTRDTLLILENPLGQSRKYSVLGFTGDPLFEAYGPFHAVRNEEAVSPAVRPEKPEAVPGQAQIVQPKRHGVQSKEEWINLDDHSLSVSFNESLQFPQGVSKEWEIAQTPDFKNPIHRFLREDRSKSLYLGGLPNGDYYARMRLWSGPRETLTEPWIQRGQVTAEANEGPLWKDPVQNHIRVHDDSIIAWDAAEGARFYRIKLWHQDGAREAFVFDHIVTSEPFLQVRKYTENPVNHISIVPYSGHPDLGGIRGAASGRIGIKEINGIQGAKEPIRAVTLTVRKGDFVLSWPQVSGARIYRVQSLAADSAEEKKTTEFWTEEDSHEIILSMPAKYVRVQPWSAPADKGGMALSGFSVWQQVDATFRTPAAVPAESVKILPASPADLRPLPVLTFARMEGVEGYFVKTQDVRSGLIDFWVPQPAAPDLPQLVLSKDTQSVAIQAATRRIAGKVSEITRIELDANVPLDELQVPFEIDSSSGTTSFYYPLNRVPAPGMRVFIQYVTQYKNEQEYPYPIFQGDLFAPSQSLDRIKARLVWTDIQGNAILGDWSNWREVEVRIPAPSAVENIIQETTTGQSVSQTVRAVVPAAAAGSPAITGYRWQTRMDLNDPLDEPQEYATKAKYSADRLLHSPETLLVPRPANWIRAKAVSETPVGSVGSEQWSEWIPVQIRPEQQPEAVADIQVLEDGHTLSFKAKEDPRVRAYRIETSQDPYNGIQPQSTYTQSIIRENDRVMNTGTLFNLPVPARYVRVTPVVTAGEDILSYGKTDGWVKIETTGIVLLDRMAEPQNQGPVIYGRSVPGATHYRIQVKNRFGTVREVVSGNPWHKATGSFVAYRMQPLIAQEKNGEEVVLSEGELPAWRSVPEVPIVEPRVPHLTLHHNSAYNFNQLRWNAEYLDQAGKSLGITLHAYRLEFEDAWGNHFGQRISNGNAYILTGHEVKARIKAIKEKHFDVRKDWSLQMEQLRFESDWSEWIDLPRIPELLVKKKPTLEMTPEKNWLVVEPLPGAKGYSLTTVWRSGYRKEDVYDIETLRKINWRIPMGKSKKDPVLKLMWLPLRTLNLLHREEVPGYAHDWIYVPGVEPDILPRPYLSGNTPVLMPEEREGKPFRGPLHFSQFGLDNAGEMTFLGREDKVHHWYKPGMAFWGFLTVELDAAGGVERESEFSDLIPSKPVQDLRPEVEAPQSPEVKTAPLITWPEVHFRVSVGLKKTPEKLPLIFFTREPYPPAAAIPEGQEAYQIEIEPISGFRVRLERDDGPVFELTTKNTFLNLSDVPAGHYRSVQIGVLSKGDPTGVHGSWSDPKAVKIRRQENLLTLRPASETEWAAQNSDGTTAYYSRQDGRHLRSVPGQAGLAGPKMLLRPEEVGLRGDRWNLIQPELLAEFGSQIFSERYRMQNNVWGVRIPVSIQEQPGNLPGITSSANIHWTDAQHGRQIISGGSMELDSKEYENTAPGSIEARWASQDGEIKISSRKYLVPHFRAGVSEFSAQTVDGRAVADPIMAITLTPSEAKAIVNVSQWKGYRIFWFGSGQFAAVADRDLAGWYLGADAPSAALDPSMANGLTHYQGAGENAVIYVRLKAARLAIDHGPQGIYNPELGDRLNSVFVFSGEAAPAELGSVLDGAVQFSTRYETAFASFAQHGSQTGILPKEMVQLFFIDSLSNQAWRTLPNGHKTYWEMVGLSETAPEQVLWTNASWPGNSAIAQQLNARLLPILRASQGNDRINTAGEGLLADRIIPNAEWLSQAMQTPADSFYMKIASAMRAHVPDGEYLIDNQQISAILSRPAGIALMRGYEPLEGLSIAGGGFTLGEKGASETWNLQKPGQFDFHLELDPQQVVDPAQLFLSGTRIYDHRQGQGRVEETVTLAKGEYALRYQLKLHAHNDLELKNTRVAMSYLDADQDLESNPEHMPGYQGENGLVIPGMDRVFHARELLESGTGSRIENGSWVDLLDFFKKDGQLTEQGKTVKKTLRDIGALGVVGWDKAGLMFVPGGVDYDKGFRILVQINESPGDRDHDAIIEFSDIVVELPAAAESQKLKAGETYTSAAVYFTNFWLRLGVTDDRGMAEDLKHLSADWIVKVLNQEADGLSMETDYAYTEVVMSLWKTADLMLDEMQKAVKENRPEDARRYRGLAARYGLSAMRGTVAARDADHSFYDLDSGRVREDIMNFKGVMRFYGTYALTYGMARDFTNRIEALENSDPELVFWPSAQGDRQSLARMAVEEAQAMAAQEIVLRDKSARPADRLQHQARFEIYTAKAAKFEALEAGLETRALEALAAQGEESLKRAENEDQRYAGRMQIYFSNRQLAYARLLQKYATVFPGKTTADYWAREILYNAERILDLQEKDENRANYGGFYQNEQPSRMQLDDNGTKLQALRTAYELVSREILNQTNSPGLRLTSTPRMVQLYTWRQAYLEAVEINIHSWLRVDARDGHLYGMESAKSEENYDSQRTEYGNAVYRNGLCSWLDLIPEASWKFDQSSRQHMSEREDGSRNYSTTGFESFVSFLNPANGNDTPTESGSLELMAYAKRASGGSYAAANTIELLEEGQNSNQHPAPLIRPVWSRAEWAAILQIMAEIAIGLQVLQWLVRGAKALWHRLAKALKLEPFMVYQSAILSGTLFLGWLYTLTHDFSQSRLIVVLLMTAAATCSLKNVAETLVRYFRIGMIRDRHRHRGVSRLNSRSFSRRIPLHLGTLLSVPIFTRHEKDARVSHGTAAEAEGAFHHSVHGNLEDSQGLFFHINDSSPDGPDAAGFNPKKFHEDYIRQMIERYGDRFIYTHQADSTEQKMGVVQNLDSWWVALRETALQTVNTAWDRLTMQQQTALKRLAYGVREPLEILQQNSPHEALISLPGGYEVRAELPESEDAEVLIEVPVKRQDKLTAVLSFWIRRTAEGYEVYHHREDPEDDTVILQEMLNGSLKDRMGLAPLEKEAMIEEEARALLYSFWASEYGGTDTRGDEAGQSAAYVTSGRSATLSNGMRAALREDLSAAGLDVDAFWGWDAAVKRPRPGSLAAQLSLAMVEHEVVYFDKVRDIAVLNDLNFEQAAAQKGLKAAALLPAAFDPSVQAWTEMPEGDVPMEGDVDKNAVPGIYYTLNDQTGKLEPYKNKATDVIDETARVWTRAFANKSQSGYAKTKDMRKFLQEANPVLKRIHEIMPVRKSYQVRYNPELGRTEVLEETWNLYQYEYDDGSRKSFFRVERKIRVDTLVGHLPTLGPLAYAWRFDADTHSGKVEKDTLVQGILRAGHPHYQPLLDPATGRAVSGYGGMVLPLRISNRDDTLWTEIEGRNRDKAGWDLQGQWLGFGEAQYTGKGIENLVSADKSKSHRMPKGFYLSHDMLEQGYNGPVSSNAEFRDKIRKGEIVLERYGRPMSAGEALEVLELAAQRGGFGLLADLWGYEDYFESHSDTLFKTMGQWKKGDWQWLHAAWGGLDIRGRLRLPGMMPGYTISERRTLEQAAVLVDGKPQRSMIGQDYKKNPLSEPQKYFLARTVEDDQRGAVMFVWLTASLLLTMLNHNTYTLLSNPWLGAFLLGGSVVLIVYIMKFAAIFKDIRREGLRPRHLLALWRAAGDTIIETAIVPGINLWKGLVSSAEIMMSIPSMKWVTSASRGGRPGIIRTLREYGVGALVGLSMMAFILALHPTSAWLVFGSLFLGSLIAGPLLTWITTHSPLRARIFLGLTVLSGSAMAILISRLDSDMVVRSARLYGFRAGLAAFAILGVLIAWRMVRFIGSAGLDRLRYGVRNLPAGVSAAAAWMGGLLIPNSYLALVHPVYTGWHSLFTGGKRFKFSSAADYFFVSGKDPQGFFANRPKSIGNLVVTGGLWALPLIMPQLYLPLAAGNAAFATALAAFHVGLFFPAGFWLLEHVLNPARPFRIYQPADYLRAAFHTVSAVIGLGLWTLKNSWVTLKAVVTVPRNQWIYRRFLSVPVSREKELQLFARQTASLLRNSPAWFRRQTARALVKSISGDQRLQALFNTALLDEKMERDLTDEFSKFYTPVSGARRQDFSDKPQTALKKRSELRQASQIESARSLRFSPQARSAALILDIQRLQGAVILDAVDFKNFSTAQKEEIVKTALSKRARILVYQSTELTPEDHAYLTRTTRVRLIPQGRERALRLASGSFVVIQVISDAARSQHVLEFTQTPTGRAAVQVKTFQQVLTGEPGLVTAALLAVQYGDRYRFFTQQGSIYVLTDSAALALLQDFLSHEVVGQSA